MSITINTNLSSLVVQLSMKGSTIDLNRAIERMTTGYKINSAKDDAAGYSISTNMTTKIGAYRIAETNATTGLDMVSTAVNTLDLMSNQLSRLRSLAIQAQNGTYGSQSVSALQTEANTIIDSLNQLMSSAEYNGKKLFSEGVSASAFSQSGIPEVEESGLIEYIPAARTMSLRTLSQVNEPEVEESAFIGEITHVDTSNMKTLTSAVTDGETIKGGTWAIGSVEDLVKLAELTNTTTDNTTGTTFVLSDDIDLSGIDNWTPIGDYYTKNAYIFRGTFNGNGHKISNLTINNPSKSYQGLFGYVDRATIENLGLENVDIKGNGEVGALVGRIYGTTTITNCYSKGTVYGGSSWVGGLIGDVYRTTTTTTITNCYSTGTFSGKDHVGGLVGAVNGTTINNCYSAGTVSAGSSGYVGGLVGLAADSSSPSTGKSTITNSYSTCTVSAGSSDYVGGFVGRCSGAIITSCYSTGTVSGPGSKVGGFVGYCFGDDIITNCYSTGPVSGSGSYIGGFVGSSAAAITNCYSTGIVSGSGSYLGGFAGNNFGGTKNDSNYYNSDSNSVGVGYSSSTGVTGKPLSELQNQTFLESLGFTAENGWTYPSETSNPVLPFSTGGSGGETGGSGGETGGSGGETGGSGGATGGSGGAAGGSGGATGGSGGATGGSGGETGGSGGATGGSGGATGGSGGTITLQIGIDSSEYSKITLNMGLNKNLLVGLIGLDISGNNAISAIDAVIQHITSKQTELGAIQNRLESVLDSISVQYENLVSARSTVRDADVAKESAAYIKSQILQNASATLLATANQSSALALTLIGGLQRRG